MIDEKDRPYHEVANIFPLMQGDEFEALKVDIAEHGQREPIWLHLDDGSIIDGRNRHRVCCELGIAPKFKPWDGKGSLIAFVLSLNLHRRHLNSLQRAGVAVDILPMLEEEARERQIALAGIRRNGDLSQKVDGGNDENEGKATAQAAALSGTNRQYVSDMKRYKEQAPEVYDMARAGSINGSGARKLEKLDSSVRAQVIQAMREDSTDDVQKALRKVIEQNLAEYTPPLPTGKYRVIYADPPWQYSNTMPPGTTQPDEYYKLMPTEDICAMPIKEIAEDNAVLFLWSTAPHFPAALQVAEAWGFEYKTNLIWDKIKHNMGHYSSVRHEHLLVCVRGSCQPDRQQLFDSVQSIERTEHSRKPEFFREIIGTIYPKGARIELFARQRTAGWDAYGNEIDE